jgi:hypothetical protein
MIINLLTGFVCFIVFGYLEKTLSLGWVVSGGLLLRALTDSRSLLFSSRSLALLALFAVHISLSDTSTSIPFLHKFHFMGDFFPFYERQRLCGAVFLLIVWVYLREEPESSGESDVVVDFGPHEEEVRKYLLQHDPSMLYKVKR